MFLSVAAVAVSPGFPARARVDQFWVSARELTFLMDSRIVLRLQRFFLSLRELREATPDLLLPSMRRRLRQPSPLLRIGDPFHTRLIGSPYRTFGRSRASPVMSQDHFLQAAACLTTVIHSGQFALPLVGRVNGSRRRFMQGRWLAHHPGRNAVSRSRLAWPLRHIAFSGPSGGGALATYLPRKSGSAGKTFCTDAIPHR
jgi:hypothetical protein